MSLCHIKSVILGVVKTKLFVQKVILFLLSVSTTKICIYLLIRLLVINNLFIGLLRTVSSVDHRFILKGFTSLSYLEYFLQEMVVEK